MKAVIQRVRNANCIVNGKVTGEIERGMLVYFSVSKEDNISMLHPFLEKMVRLRFFEDDEGKMNRSLKDIDGSILFISQFTLYADLSRGNRPDFAHAMNAIEAEKFYLSAIEILRQLGYNVSSGIFGAHMHINYENDGPVTLILDSSDISSIKKLSLTEN